MKSLLTVCLLLTSTPAIASAQQKTVGRTETRLPHTSLTRAQTGEGERRLSDVGYWTGAVDGLINPATGSALIAFQKCEARPYYWPANARCEPFGLKRLSIGMKNTRYDRQLVLGDRVS